VRYFLAVLTACAFLAASAAAVPPATNTTPRLFSDYGVLKMRLEAPFQTLFATATSKSDETAVEGTLSYTDPASNQEVSIGPVKVSVRGNTSRRDSECTFPKLKIDLPRNRVAEDSLFAGIKAVKVGTHCGERPDGQLTKLGRWANQKSPIREAFVYRLLDAVGVATLKARPAEIAYVDNGQSTVRSAFLLEDDAAAIARFGATGQVEHFDNARDTFAVDDTAAVAFAEAMIGNFDWAIKFSPDDYYRNDDANRLWNVLALERADGTAFPVIYDFDLAGSVTGAHPWFDRVYFDGILPSRSHRAIEVLGQVQRTRTLFSRAQLDRSRTRFTATREKAYRVLDEATLDDEGRRFAREYLDAFYDGIRTDESFYRAAVVESGSLPYVKSTGDEGACGTGDHIPVGTVIGPVLGRDNGRVQAPLLDVWWHWASRCAPVHRGAVWVDAQAIAADFPAR
jgi:hypothetical protein